MATQPCSFQEGVAALARDELAGDARRGAQRHLENCESCRAEFRRLSEGRLPRLRSYTFIERTGAGGFGQVFKVIHHSKERTEALKLLHAYSRLRAASFENEVHLIAQLRHPNIAALYDAHLGTPPFYYTMEYVEGRPLDEFFRSSNVQLVQRIEVLRQVAGAMDYAHRQGVVHRDLKPGNILVDAAGQPRIVDFGIARMLAPRTAEADRADERALPPHRPEGTDGYIAPEELAGHAVDGRADTYALGALLCCSVTGRSPPADEQPETLTSTLRELGVRRPADLAAIIDKCLRKQPAERYATCQDLSDDLENYLAARPIQARRPHSLAHRGLRAAERLARNRPRLILGCLAILAVATMTGVLNVVDARWVGPVSQTGAVALIEFRPSTIAAIRESRVGADLAGLSAETPKSWRLLHGSLMQALSDAGPRAVVCDYFVPDCRPEYDGALIEGLEALKAAGIPVVFGSKRFDVNGRPVGCPHVLEAVHAWGALQGADPARKPDEFFVPLCIVRGLAPPIPSLSLAGYAAARFSDSTLDLRPGEQEVRLAYRRRGVGPGEREWREQIDAFLIGRREQGNPSSLLGASDEMLFARVPRDSVETWPARAIPAEVAMTMSPTDLRDRVEGRVVLYGPALPGEDQYELYDGSTIFGCWVQAQAMSSFLGDLPTGAARSWEWLIRASLWALLALFIVRLLPVPNGGVPAIAMVGFALGVVAAIGGLAWGAWYTPPNWTLELLIAGCTLLATGSAAYLYRRIRAGLNRIEFTNAPRFPHESAAEPSTAL